MWHYPTAGQKKSKGAVFQKEQEVPKGAGGSERDGRFRERRQVPRETAGSERNGRFREEQEVPKGAGGFRGKVFRRGASGEMLRGRCFGGDASGEMLRGCFKGNASKGMLWDVLGCSGKLKETRKIQSNKVKQKKHLRLCLQSTITISRANVQSSA